MDRPKYYRPIVHATEDVLGPAAERFVKRQIEFHLGKTPDSLTRSDIPKLKQAVGVALKLLTDDQTIIDQTMQKIDEIAKE